jgi:hypothetical protein
VALGSRLAVSGVPHAARTRHMLRASERPNEDGACGQAARRKVAGNSLPDVYRAMRSLEDKFRLVEWLKFRAKCRTLFAKGKPPVPSPYGAALSDFGEKFKRRHISPIDSRDIHQTLIESVHRAHLDHENQPKSQTKTIFAEIGEVAAFPSE